MALKLNYWSREKRKFSDLPEMSQNQLEELESIAQGVKVLLFQVPRLINNETVIIKAQAATKRIDKYSLIVFSSQVDGEVVDGGVLIDYGSLKDFLSFAKKLYEVK